jgi:hypothetical protein
VTKNRYRFSPRFLVTEAVLLGHGSGTNSLFSLILALILSVTQSSTVL